MARWPRTGPSPATRPPPAPRRASPRPARPSSPPVRRRCPPPTSPPCPTARGVPPIPDEVADRACPAPGEVPAAVVVLLQRTHAVFATVGPFDNHADADA